MRTYVRASPWAAILREQSDRSDRSQPIVGRDTAAPGHVHAPAEAAGCCRSTRTSVGISTEHFDPYAAPARTIAPEYRAPAERDPRRGLDVQPVQPQGASVPTEGSSSARCCLCGQDETGTARGMSLILDHINGVSGTTTGSRTCGSCARTAPRRSTRTADASADRTARTANACTAATPFGPTTRATATARPPAAAGGTGRGRPRGRRGALSGRRSTSCSR